MGTHGTPRGTHGTSVQGNPWDSNGKTRHTVGNPNRSRGISRDRNPWHTVGFRGNSLEISRESHWFSHGVSHGIPWAPTHVLRRHDHTIIIRRWFPRAYISKTTGCSGSSRGKHARYWEFPRDPAGCFFFPWDPTGKKHPARQNGFPWNVPPTPAGHHGNAVGSHGKSRGNLRKKHNTDVAPRL